MLDVAIFGGSWLITVILLMIAIQLVAKYDAETNPYLSIFWGFILFGVESSVIVWALIKGPETEMPLIAIFVIAFCVLGLVGVLVVNRFLYASISQSIWIMLIVITGKVLYLVLAVIPLLSAIHDKADPEGGVELTPVKWENREAAGLEVYSPGELFAKEDAVPEQIQRLSREVEMFESAYPHVSVQVMRVVSKEGDFNPEAAADAVIENLKEEKLGEPAIANDQVEWEGLPARNLYIVYDGREYGGYLIFGLGETGWIVSSWASGMEGGRLVDKVTDSVRKAGTREAGDGSPAGATPATAPAPMEDVDAGSPGSQETAFPIERTIRNAEGQSIEVTILGRSESKVSFRNAAGKTFQYEIGSLSEADQEFLRKLPVTMNDE